MIISLMFQHGKYSLAVIMLLLTDITLILTDVLQLIRTRLLNIILKLFSFPSLKPFFSPSSLLRSFQVPVVVPAVPPPEVRD